MASGTLVDGGGDVPRKNRWIENKVYTRRIFKKGLKNGSQPPPSQTVASEDGNLSSLLQQQSSTRLDAKDLASDDSTSLQQQQQQVPASGDKRQPEPEREPEPETEPPTKNDQNDQRPIENGEPHTENCSVQTFENHVNISLSSMSKQEIREVKHKLVDELEQVRDWLKQLESKELQLLGCPAAGDVVDNCTAGVADDCALVDVNVDVEGVTGVGGGADCNILAGGVAGGPGPGGGVTVDSDSPHSAANNLVSYGDGRGMITEFNLDTLNGRMSSGANLENGGTRRFVSDVSMDSGGSRRMIPEVSSNNGGGRGMMSDDIDFLDTGAGTGIFTEFSLDDDYDAGEMVTDVNYGNGGATRVVPEAGLDYSVGRRIVSNVYLDNGDSRRLIPEVSLVGKRDPPRSLHQLRVSVMENSHGGLGDYVDKEKRTPKVNQYYRNSDFIVGKEKFPPPNKKSKINGSKKHGRGGRRDYAFGLIKQTSHVFKHCNSLLTKLMKHKHGWVFNEPVDVEGLGLHDYFFIIKHPMDLGTVKTRLNTNFYGTPREFAEDVRLTFSNAMTYNPKGQDVHIMAEQLSHIFEDRWAIMETEYNLDAWFEPYHEESFPTPVTKRPPLIRPEMGRSFERVQSMPQPVASKPVYHGSSRRGAALKKPKAKDLNKRDMTYEEKQKLSTNLQNMPAEKQDSIVEIIKRRSASLVQNDDQIEVDIDSVDNETLWELDRFVTNYKKSLSKYKRKAELAMQARKEAERNAREKNQAPSTVGLSKETKIDERNMGLQRPHQEDKPQDNISRSSSSSSSSSDSGSSSSDSDSDSSSESDAEHSPRS